jgi:hypothetical protein
MTKMLSVLVLVAMSFGGGDQPAPPGSIATQIFVEPMGTDHEAVYFRKLLSDHLRRAGLATADTPSSPLVLVTTLSTPVVGGETRAYATAELRAGDGRVQWSTEFPKSDGWRQARGRDALTKLAEEIATAVARRPS